MGSELQVKFLEVDEVRCGLRSGGGGRCRGGVRMGGLQAQQAGARDEQGTAACARATWCSLRRLLPGGRGRSRRNSEEAGVVLGRLRGAPWRRGKRQLLRGDVRQSGVIGARGDVQCSGMTRPLLLVCSRLWRQQRLSRVAAGASAALGRRGTAAGASPGKRRSSVGGMGWGRLCGGSSSGSSIWAASWAGLGWAGLGTQCKHVAQLWWARCRWDQGSERPCSHSRGRGRPCAIHRARYPRLVAQLIACTRV